jgi:hypothetical protein
MIPNKVLASMIVHRQSCCEQTPSELLGFILKEKSIEDKDSQIFISVMIIFEEEFARCTSCGWIASRENIENEVCYDCMFDQRY